MEDKKAKTEAAEKMSPEGQAGTVKEYATAGPVLFGGGTAKKILVTMLPTRTSLFGSIAPSIIMEGRKSCLTRKAAEDLIVSFADALAMWKEVGTKLAKGKSGARPLKEVLMRDIPKTEFAPCYASVCSLFKLIVSKLEDFSFAGTEEHLQKAFSEELILVAALGIQHTNVIALDTLAQSLDSAETELNHKTLDECFAMLHTFHEFFFALVKLRCNPVLTDRQLTVLHDICKGTLGALQMKVQSNFKLLHETRVQTAKLRAIATLIYYVLQTVAVLSIFGEVEGQTASKYQHILERFKTIFALISQSAVFDKVFSEQYDFESAWNVHKGKYMITSFNQKRLTIFLQEHRLPADTPIVFSLKYLVVYYNYKVLRLISQRIQVSYDEHILSIFSILIHKNRSLLGSLIAQKDKQSELKVMLLINENMYILKSYIMNLAYFSDSLDPMQRQAKYDTIKDTTIDCLSLAIKFAMYWHPESAEGVNQLTIFEPKDFVAVIFKALLLYNKVKTKHASVKFCHEMIRHINILATDLASRPIPTDDAVCLYTYRLYLLQFLSQWDMESLKEKYMKYSEEMSRYLADFTEDGLESEVMRQLKFRNQDLALELYVRLAQLDCEPPIEATIGFIRESFTNERKLYKYFYIMFCLLCQKKVPLESFKAIMDQDAGLLDGVVSPLRASKETAVFLQKEGMGVVFLIYKNATASYVQTKEQRRAYELELSAPFVRKSVATAEVNTYVTQNYLKKLDETVQAYETLLQATESFVCALHHAVPIAEYFLFNPEFDLEFYQQVVNLPCGRSLILKLLKILGGHLVTTLMRPELVEKFVALIADLFQSLMETKVKFEDEKPFILSVVSIVESLIAGSTGMAKEVREIIFHRAILQLLLEICQKDRYNSDIETFQRFMRVMKLIARDNRQFYDSPQSKAQLYGFVLEQFANFMQKNLITMSVVISLLQALIDIGLETDLDLARPHPALIREPSAVETYFNILGRCFKVLPEESNAELKAHVLVPLEAMSGSLMNDCILSKVAVQELLMKILKRANEKEFQRQVSSHIGRISSTNTTARHIQLLMRHFLKSSKYVSEPLAESYYHSLLDTLTDSISGDSIRSLFFFSGQEKSYIQLKNPLPALGQGTQGLCWTGSIRLERGNKDRKQCIFSFLKVKPNEVKGVELYVHERKLLYKMVQLRKGDSSVTIVLPNIEIREDAWLRITMGHIGRELIVHAGETSCTLDAPTQAFAKNEYNSATIGAAMDPSTNQHHSFFFGEMSALYFFHPTLKFKEVIKDLAYRGQYLKSMYKHEGIVSEASIYSQDPNQYKGLKYIDREFIASTHFILDPKCNIFSRQSNEDIIAVKGRSLNMLESLQETELFFNRPAKDVFYNLGGFKTALPLLASRLQFRSATAEQDARVCSGILKLLHTLCLNNEPDAMNFLVVEHGIEILKHLFEKVGEHGKFSIEFVNLLFKILDLPSVSPTKPLLRVVPALVEKVVFNINIWSNSEFSVQRFLMERAHDLLVSRTKLQFSPGEPYKCMLRMLYDYFAPEEGDDGDLRKFLNIIRSELIQIIINYFQQYGSEETVPTLVEFLLPRHDYMYSIRDLLYIVLLYQSPQKKAGAANVVVAQLNALCKAKKKEFDILAALHTLINYSIVQKGALLKALKIEDPAFTKSKIDCCDYIISYAVHILLSLQWPSILESEDTSITLAALISGVQNVTPAQKGSHSPLLLQLNAVFAKADSFLTCLNPARYKGRLSSPEEIILHFLFHRLDPAGKKEKYEKRFLGEKTYLALLSHMLPDPAQFYLAEKDLAQRVRELKSTELVSRSRQIFGKILENLSAFEPPVQRKIVVDTCRFIENKAVFLAFLRMDNVFEAVSGYLCRPKYLAEPVMKSSLERFYLIFITNYWKMKRVRMSSQNMFKDLWHFSLPEFLLMTNQIVDTVLGEVAAGPCNDDSVCALIQFVYFLEDASLRFTHMLAQSQYIDLVAKTLLCLSEARILYFWYPSFFAGHIPKDVHYDSEECPHREGGVVRAMLKLILSLIARNGEKSGLDLAHLILPLKLLSFFIFRKRKTQKTIEKILKISLPERPVAAASKGEAESTSFLEFTPKGSFAQSKLKLILHDKTMTHQKSVEEVMKYVGSRKDSIESVYYRGLLLITQLSQLFIYTDYGISSYRELLFQAKEPTPATADRRLFYLAKLLGRVVKVCLSGGTGSLQKYMEELGKDVRKLQDYPIEQCYSNFDQFTKESIEAARPYSSDYSSTGGKSRSSAASTESETDFVQYSRKALEECVGTLVQVNEKFGLFTAKKISGTDFANAIVDVLVVDHFVKVIQPGLHKLVSEDFLLIERGILVQAESKQKLVRRASPPKLQSKEQTTAQELYRDKERISKMRKLVHECSKKLAKHDNDLTIDEESNTIEKEYEELRKTVISEHAFMVADRESERIFDIVGKYYAKILDRCPLNAHQKELDSKSSASGNVGFKAFVKIDPARDNLGRALRLKKMHNPLQNPSILRGIAYVRQFFLKRILVRSLACRGEEELVEQTKELEKVHNFLIPSPHHHILLKALMERTSPKVRLSVMMKRVEEEKTPMAVPGSLVLARANTTTVVTPGGYAIKACVSRSQLARECNVRPKKERISLEAEIIRCDHSIFGHIKFSEKEITFSNKIKNLDKPEYRLGSTRLMCAIPSKKMRKIWRYADIARIIARHYNLIKQAVEIQFKNRKSVFLVLFSEAHLTDFFSIMEQQLLNSKRPLKSIAIIRDSKKEFAARKLTEEWKRRRLSNFEYLTLINDYASRSFQSLAQYPVFPWILQSFGEKELALSATEFRDLRYPISGITQRKRDEAIKKYENTEDFPGGRFQFGSHYLPGRAVLGYLMRLQPYTLMIYRFDSGGDCPSRHFHMLETMWNNIKIQCDNNLELIPEFYYCPEFLANQYSNHYSFGVKQLEDNYGALSGQMVRVDVVNLPKWAENRHHFIMMNYLALEHPKTRSVLHSWIDLMFGDKQQKHEAFNLFKPLACEKTVRAREESGNKLDAGDISQIAEFGHNPTQIFERPHPAFEDKMYESTRLVFDIFNEQQKYSVWHYKQKEGDSHCPIRVMVKDKNNVVVVTSGSELLRKQLVAGKNECKNTGPTTAVSRYFSISSPPKEFFTVDPQSVFTFNNEYIVACRGHENDFTIYNYQSLAFMLTIGFHKTVVNAVHLTEREDILYTGDLDGVVAVWKLSDVLQGTTGGSKRPKVLSGCSLQHYMTDHTDTIVSLDSNAELDLYASASKTCCVLRVASNNQYFLTISPEMGSRVKYTIFKVLLSPRGYVIFLGRSAYKAYERDIVVVYSINGERISCRELEESVNAVLLDPHGYFIVCREEDLRQITGGTGKKLRRYCVVTLREEDLHLSIDNFAVFPATIASLSYVPGKLHYVERRIGDKTVLLVGLINAQLYVVDFYVKPEGVGDRMRPQCQTQFILQ